MKRFNLKLAAVLIAGAALLAAVVPWLHARQIRRRVAELRYAASQAEEQGRHADAAKLLKDYVALAPHDTLALEHLAYALDKTDTAQSAIEAISVFEQVLRRTPERDDVRRRLVRVAMEHGLTRLAANHLKNLIAADPANGELHQLLGECLDADGQYIDATDSFETAVLLMSDHLHNYERLADLYRRRLDQPELADELMDEMVAQNGESFQAFLARSRYRRSLGSLDGAAEDLTRAAEIAPNEPDVLLAAAELDQSADRNDRARESLTRGIDEHADDARLYRSLARVELRVGRRDAAIAALRAGLDALPDHPDLLWTLAELLIESKQINEAREFIARLKQQLPADAPAGLLDAAILMHEEHWREARDALEDLLPKLSSTELAKQANLYLGRCYQRLQDAVRQIAALRRALDIDPAWVPARWELALSEIDLGRTADAISELRLLSALPEAPAATLPLLAQLLLAQNLATREGERNWSEFDDTLARLDRVAPPLSSLPILRAAAAAARGRTDEACDLLRNTLDQQPKRLVVWLAYVQLLNQSGRSDEAARALGEAETRVGSAALPAIARSYESIGRLDLAKARFDAALTERAGDPQLLAAAADFCLRHARTVDAERHLRAIIEEHSRASQQLAAWARRGLAVVLATRGGDAEYQEAQQLIEQNMAGGLEPNDDARARAVVLATRPDAAARREAIRILHEASQRWTPRPNERFLLVQLCDAEGEWTRARKHMLGLVVGPDPDATYLAYFVEHMIRHGETDEARLWLDRLAPLATRDRTRLVVLLADELAHQGQSRNATEFYRMALEQDDRHVVALNNLAWLAARGFGNTADALALLDRAIEVAGPRPELRDTRATVYLADGRWEDAVRELETAIRESPSPTKYFHLARARLTGRDVAAAQAAFREATSRGLKKDTLHPTEQLDYDKLVFEMDSLSPSD